MQFSELNQQSLEDLKKAIQQALEEGQLFDDERSQEMMERLQQLSPEQMQQLLDRLVQKMVDEGHISHRASRTMQQQPARRTSAGAGRAR